MATEVPESESERKYVEGELETEKAAHHPIQEGQVELQDTDAWDKLGYSFPTWRKWQILCVVFLIQISMNLNASMYANAVDSISENFGVTKQVARIPQMTFLVAYAFGCELWAPWSEEYGRWPIQQLSLFLVNIWQIRE